MWQVDRQHEKIMKMGEEYERKGEEDKSMVGVKKKKKKCWK
jgi:hypothetical protein